MYMKQFPKTVTCLQFIYIVRNSKRTPIILFPTVPKKVVNAQNVLQKNYDKQTTNKYNKDIEDRNWTVLQVLEENPYDGVGAIE